MVALTAFTRRTATGTRAGRIKFGGAQLAIAIRVQRVKEREGGCGIFIEIDASVLIPVHQWTRLRSVLLHTKLIDGSSLVGRETILVTGIEGVELRLQARNEFRAGQDTVMVCVKTQQ